MNEPNQNRETTIAAGEWCCPQWKEESHKVKAYYIKDGKERTDNISPFKFCPWCGKAPIPKKRTERSMTPRRSTEVGRRGYDLDFKSRPPKSELYTQRLRDRRSSIGAGNEDT